MPYEIRYSNEAVEQLKKLRIFDRTAILGQEVVLIIQVLSKPDSIEYLGGSP